METLKSDKKKSLGLFMDLFSCVKIFLNSFFSMGLPLECTPLLDFVVLLICVVMLICVIPAWSVVSMAFAIWWWCCMWKKIFYYTPACPTDSLDLPSFLKKSYLNFRFCISVLGMFKNMTVRKRQKTLVIPLSFLGDKIGQVKFWCGVCGIFKGRIVRKR